MEVSAEMNDRLRKVEMQIGTHEAVCAERYNGILKAGADTKAAIDKMQGWAIKIGILLIGGMATVLLKLVFFAHS